MICINIHWQSAKSLRIKSFARNPLVGQCCYGTGGTHWSFVSLVMSLLCLVVKCTRSPCFFFSGTDACKEEVHDCDFHRHCICPWRCRSKINNSERPVDALAKKHSMTHWLTDNLESRDASASKNDLDL